MGNLNFKKGGLFFEYLNSENYKNGKFPRCDVPHLSGNSYFKESASFFGYDGYSTAIPILTALVAISEGTVIEFGGGNSSTPVLSALTTALGRRFISFESDKTWIKAVKHAPPYNREVLEYDPNNIDISLDYMKRVLNNEKLAVVFIDGDKPYKHRGELLRKLPDIYKAAFVISHDYDVDNDTSNFLSALDSYRCNYMYEAFYPYTLISCNDIKSIVQIENLNIVKRVCQ